VFIREIKSVVAIPWISLYQKRLPEGSLEKNPNLKHQITNKHQTQMIKIQKF